MEILGTPGDDTLHGGLEPDRILGLQGDDYILGHELRDTLIGGGGRDTLLGGGGADELVGNTGDDVLDGGYGPDIMRGGAGDDHYYVNDAGDVVIENPDDAGVDTIHVEFSYALPENVEALDLHGNANANGTGHDGDNYLLGNRGNNRLRGMDGNDTLNGGHRGRDTLDGGEGDDYLYANEADRVVFLGGNGNDTIDATHIRDGYRMEGGDGNDRLLLRGGDGGAMDGGAGDDYLEAVWDIQGIVMNGGAGNDTLIGGGRFQDGIMRGGRGDDSYVLGGGAEFKGDVIELDGQGYDTVEVHSHSFTAQGEIERIDFYGQTATITGSEIDNLIHIHATGKPGTVRAFGGEGDDRIVLHGEAAFANGGAGDDTIIGSGADDTIRGGGGDDVLNGAAGNALMEGGSGRDVFVLSGEASGAVAIADFNGDADRFRLRDFDNLDTQGALDAAHFHAGTAAQDADDYIVFDSAAGALYYDTDGNGAQSQVLIANVTVENGNLDHTDFMVS